MLTAAAVGRFNAARLSAGDDLDGLTWTGARMFAVVVLVALLVGCTLAPVFLGSPRAGSPGSSSPPLGVGMRRLAALLMLTAPAVAWCAASGGLSADRAIVGLGALALVLAVAVTVSALLATLIRSRTTWHVACAGVLLGAWIGMPVLAWVATPAQTVTFENLYTSTGEPVTERVLRTDLTWWLLAIHPIAVVADPIPDAREPLREIHGDVIFGQGPHVDPLGGAKEIGHMLRDDPTDTRAGPRRPGWPVGLSAYTLAGATAVMLIVSWRSGPRRTGDPDRRRL